MSKPCSGSGMTSPSEVRRNRVKHLLHKRGELYHGDRSYRIIELSNLKEDTHKWSGQVRQIKRLQKTLCQTVILICVFIEGT
jgi:hypothetical protein